MAKITNTPFPPVKQKALQEPPPGKNPVHPGFERPSNRLLFRSHWKGHPLSGQTKEISSSVLPIKQNLLSQLTLERSCILHTEKIVSIFFSSILMLQIKDTCSQNTVLCRQLPAVLPDSITGEHCGEASAEFSILLPPRRPRFGTAVALFTWFCVCAVTLLSMDLKDGPPFRLPNIPYPMRQAAAGFWHELKSHYNKSRCRKQ